MRAIDHLQALAYSILGFGYACFTVFLAGSMAGAGHGWMAAMPSNLGIFILPAFGAAFAYRKTRVGRITLWLIAVAMVLIDLIILKAARDQGWATFHKALKLLPEILGAWTLCWIFWQFLVIYFLWKRDCHETT